MMMKFDGNGRWSKGTISKVGWAIGNGGGRDGVAM